MNVTGMLHGSRLLAHADFPMSEVLAPDATEDQIRGLIHVNSGLIGKAPGLKDSLANNKRLYLPKRPPWCLRLISKAADLESLLNEQGFGTGILLRSPCSAHAKHLIPGE
jgi:hypothetical protein